MTPQELKRLRAETTAALQKQLVTQSLPLFRLGRMPELYWPEFVVRQRPYDQERDG